MLVFTVTMGFTAFLMAWMTLVFTVRGWAVRRELPPALAGAVEDLEPSPATVTPSFEASVQHR
jgi:hypothetical protein